MASVHNAMHTNFADQGKICSIDNELNHECLSSIASDTSLRCFSFNDRKDLFDHDVQNRNYKNDCKYERFVKDVDAEKCTTHNSVVEEKTQMPNLLSNTKFQNGNSLKKKQTQKNQYVSFDNSICNTRRASMQMNVSYNAETYLEPFGNTGFLCKNDIYHLNMDQADLTYLKFNMSQYKSAPQIRANEYWNYEQIQNETHNINISTLQSDPRITNSQFLNCGNKQPPYLIDFDSNPCKEIQNFAELQHCNDNAFTSGLSQPFDWNNFSQSLRENARITDNLHFCCNFANDSCQSVAFSNMETVPYERDQNCFGETLGSPLVSDTARVCNHGYDNAHGDFVCHERQIIEHPTKPICYELVEVLGRGESGNVIKCNQRIKGNGMTTRQVALKIVRNHIAYFNQAAMEVWVLKRICDVLDPNDSQNIIRLLDYFVYQNHLCIIFELLDMTLYDILRNSNFIGLPFDVVGQITAQLVSTLHFLNQQNLIHCDMKPENILLSKMHCACQNLKADKTAENSSINATAVSHDLSCISCTFESTTSLSSSGYSPLLSNHNSCFLNNSESTSMCSATNKSFCMHQDTNMTALKSSYKNSDKNIHVQNNFSSENFLKGSKPCSQSNRVIDQRRYSSQCVPFCSNMSENKKTSNYKAAKDDTMKEAKNQNTASSNIDYNNNYPVVKIKLIDFNSACFKNCISQLYIQSRFYRAPEIVLGIKYGPAIDMWSLGCTCVELFLGYPLFPGVSKYDLLRKFIRLRGMPPDWMLNSGLFCKEFFIRQNENPTNKSSVANPSRVKIKTLKKKTRKNKKDLANGEYFHVYNKNEHFTQILTEDHFCISPRDSSWKLFKKGEYETFNCRKEPKYVSSPQLQNLDDILSVKRPFSGKVENNLNLRLAFLDFVRKTLIIDPNLRLTADQALHHPFILRYL